MAFLTPEHLVERLYLKRGAKVADFGSGSGAYTIALSHAVGEEGKVYAIDVHRDALSTLENTLLKMGFLNVETLWADLETEIHLDSFTLDAIVISNVLFQLREPGRAIREASRLLAPGGKILCVDWSGSHGGLGPHDSNVFPEDKAEELFKENGFQIGERLPAGAYHYAFLATKL